MVKKIKEEFYVKTVCKRNCEWGNRIITSGRKQTSYLSIKILKIMSVIYLIASILMAFSTGPFIHNIGFDEMSISGPELGLISIVMLGSIFQSVLVFCDMGIYPFSRNSH